MKTDQPESYYEQKLKELYSKYLQLKNQPTEDPDLGKERQIKQLANFRAINKTKQQENCYRLKKAIRTSLFRSCASVIFPKLNYKRIERIGTKRSLIRIIRKTKSEEKFNELKNNPKTFVQKLVPSLGKWLKLQEDKVKKQYEKRRVEEVIRSRVFFIFETFTENIMKINPVKKEKNRKEKQKRNTNKQKDQDEEYGNDNESDEDDDQSNDDDDNDDDDDQIGINQTFQPIILQMKQKNQCLDLNVNIMKPKQYVNNGIDNVIQKQMGIMMGNPKDDQQKKQTIGNKIINEIINTFSSIVPSKIWNNPTQKQK